MQGNMLGARYKLVRKTEIYSDFHSYIEKKSNWQLNEHKHKII